MQLLGGLFELRLGQRGRDHDHRLRHLRGIPAGRRRRPSPAWPACAWWCSIPRERISDVQRRFMTTDGGPANVRCAAVAGDFDDCQAILKALFATRPSTVRSGWRR